MNEKINVRGVNFDTYSLEGILDMLVSALDGGVPLALFTPNSEIVQSCIENPRFADVINSAELIIPDGIGVVKAAKILGTPFPHGKIAGIDVGEKLVQRVAGLSHGIFLLGAESGIAESAAENLSKKYAGARFVGHHNGYFEKTGAENDAVIEEINKSGAEILFVCLGSPVQEKWITENRGRLTCVKVFLALGGALDVYSGKAKRAPLIFIRLGLEWFYRLLREPRRIGRMMKLPRFYFGTMIYKARRKK